MCVACFLSVSHWTGLRADTNLLASSINNIFFNAAHATATATATCMQSTTTIISQERNIVKTMTMTHFHNSLLAKSPNNSILNRETHDGNEHRTMDDFGWFYQDDLDDEYTSVHLSTTSLSSAVTPQDLMVDDPQPGTLQSYPPILSSTMIDKIIEDGLPWSMQDVKWTRIFASSRDGGSFGHFMRSARNVPNTIIVASTSNGKVVGGYTEDVWSGGRKRIEKERKQDFLFVFESSATSSATMTGNDNVLQENQSPIKRFIPGLEDFSSSPRGVLDFDFESLTLSSDKVNTKERQEVMHIFKPSVREAPLKQICQLGNRLISLGSDDDDREYNTDNSCYLTIENSFSKGGVSITTSEGNGRVVEEFEVVNFEMYCLSDE